jgi:lipopolysaccharide/colanic/teichoic acid biosynthesis glycosyltransferase
MNRRATLGVKRLGDLAGATVGLVVLSPILAGVAVAVLLTQGRPILFRHLRPGRSHVPFVLIKFRTMRDLRTGEARFHSDEQRITKLGRFLRSSSIDELPELWNVLRGDMSLVGPRPLLTEYLPVYTSEELRRHDMRPGITSWAAVNGRHVLKFQERLALDVWYVDHWSLGLDVRILAMTIGQVLRRQDVSATQDISEIGFPLPPVDNDAWHGPASDTSPSPSATPLPRSEHAGRLRQDAQDPSSAGRPLP